MRLGYRVAYRALQAWALVAHPRARGVKCVLDDGAGRVLFVRHHYGNRRQWELPGGGAHRGEELSAAARREALEELGADVPAWREEGTASGVWHARREEVTIFAARWPGGPVRPDPVEIAVAAWFALDAAPVPLGPTTAAAVAVLAREGRR